MNQTGGFLKHLRQRWESPLRRKRNTLPVRRSESVDHSNTNINNSDINDCETCSMKTTSTSSSRQSGFLGFSLPTTIDSNEPLPLPICRLGPYQAEWHTDNTGIWRLITENPISSPVQNDNFMNDDLKTLTQINHTLKEEQKFLKIKLNILYEKLIKHTTLVHQYEKQLDKLRSKLKQNNEHIDEELRSDLRKELCLKIEQIKIQQQQQDKLQDNLSVTDSSIPSESTDLEITNAVSKNGDNSIKSSHSYLSSSSTTTATTTTNSTRRTQSSYMSKNSGRMDESSRVKFADQNDENYDDNEDDSADLEDDDSDGESNENDEVEDEDKEDTQSTSTSTQLESSSYNKKQQKIHFNTKNVVTKNYLSHKVNNHKWDSKSVHKNPSLSYSSNFESETNQTTTFNNHKESDHSNEDHETEDDEDDDDEQDEVEDDEEETSSETFKKSNHSEHSDESDELDEEGDDKRDDDDDDEDEEIEEEEISTTDQSTSDINHNRERQRIVQFGKISRK